MLVFYMYCFPYICTWLSLITGYTLCKHSYPVMASSTVHWSSRSSFSTISKHPLPLDRFTQGSHLIPKCKKEKKQKIPNSPSHSKSASLCLWLFSVGTSAKSKTRGNLACFLISFVQPTNHHVDSTWKLLLEL